MTCKPPDVGQLVLVSLRFSRRRSRQAVGRGIVEDAGAMERCWRRRNTVGVVADLQRRSADGQTGDSGGAGGAVARAGGEVGETTLVAVGLPPVWPVVVRPDESDTAGRRQAAPQDQPNQHRHHDPPGRGSAAGACHTGRRFRCRWRQGIGTIAGDGNRGRGGTGSPLSRRQLRRPRSTHPPGRAAARRAPAKSATVG